jgi:GAF domain-containing protein
VLVGDGDVFEVSASFSLTGEEMGWKDTEEGKASIMNGKTLPHVLVGLAIEVVESGEVRNSEPQNEEGRPCKLRGYVLRHVLCAPLVDDRDVVVGLLFAINKSVKVPGGFTDEDERVMMAFCWQAVLAVNTARLLESKRNADQHRDALLEVTYAVSQELQVEDVLSIIVAKALELLRAERAMVFFLGKSKKELYTSSTAAYGTGDRLDRPAGDGMHYYSIEEAGIAGGVVNTGKVITLLTIILLIFLSPQKKR